MILYGLTSCDTCRAAQKALEAAGNVVDFVDIRKSPLDAAARAQFFRAFGMALVNRRSTTWRSLSEAERETSPDALLALYPTLMKRPVIETGSALYLGWGDDVKAALL
jgi:arsenate reductase